MVQEFAGTVFLSARGGSLPAEFGRRGAYGGSSVSYVYRVYLKKFKEREATCGIYFKKCGKKTA